jgi:hypothetical protein
LNELPNDRKYIKSVSTVLSVAVRDDALSEASVTKQLLSVVLIYIMERRSLEQVLVCGKLNFSCILAYFPL